MVMGVQGKASKIGEERRRWWKTKGRRRKGGRDAGGSLYFPKEMWGDRDVLWSMRGYHVGLVGVQ